MRRSYFISQINTQNGEPDWSHVQAAHIDQYLWLPKTDITAKAKLLYDPTGIYVHLEAAEKDIRAEYTGDYDMVCEDSCLEFFLCPDSSNNRYFNFEINPNGAMYVGFGYNNAENIRLIVPNSKEFFRIKTLITENGWEVEYKIPAAFLRTFIPSFQLHSNLKLSGNFYKCGDKTRLPHYIAWNEIECENPDFHIPEYFGSLLFE